MDFEKDFEDVCKRLTDIINDELEMFGNRHNIGVPTGTVVPSSRFVFGEMGGSEHVGVEIDFDFATKGKFVGGRI